MAIIIINNKKLYDKKATKFLTCSKLTLVPNQIIIIIIIIIIYSKNY